jgi:hypothetical protein
MVAGNYAAADMSRQSLRERREHSNGPQPVSRAVIYDIYAHAKAMEVESGIPFAQAFAKAYGDVVPRLSDPDAYSITEWLGAPRRLSGTLCKNYSISSGLETVSENRTRWI